MENIYSREDVYAAMEKFPEFGDAISEAVRAMQRCCFTQKSIDDKATHTNFDSAGKEELSSKQPKSHWPMKPLQFLTSEKRDVPVARVTPYRSSAASPQSTGKNEINNSYNIPVVDDLAIFAEYAAEREAAMAAPARIRLEIHSPETRIRRRRLNNLRGICYNCRMPGHKYMDCPEPQPVFVPFPRKTSLL
ncbi:uncharacterized protein [Prorops nasuta]|uniref:uncharacterized protein n=1 Tax=Prorops nasuta TaxID=863751 RepID=UPI0034CF13A2